MCRFKQDFSLVKKVFKKKEEPSFVKISSKFDVHVKKLVHFEENERNLMKKIQKSAENKVLKHKRNLRRMEVTNHYEQFLVEGSDDKRVNREYLWGKFEEWVALGKSERMKRLAEFDSK